MTGHERFKEEIENVLTNLMQLAASEGVYFTVELKPKLPLAQGNYEMVHSIRSRGGNQLPPG